MGLLDQLAGQVLGSLAGGAQGGGQSPLIQLVLNLIQNSEGGLGGLLSKFNQAGLGDQVASWVGTGQNLPVSADQLGQVLGGAGGLGTSRLSSACLRTSWQGSLRSCCPR